MPTVEDDFQATVIDVVIGNENEASAPDLGNATTLLCSHANPLTDFTKKMCSHTFGIKEQKLFLTLTNNGFVRLKNIA